MVNHLPLALPPSIDLDSVTLKFGQIDLPSSQSHLLPDSRVEVGLGGLDMVVEVLSQSLEVECAVIFVLNVLAEKGY